MKKNDVKVSVLCTAYNHEKFLRKCLDGFVMQKTNFKFEVIVHDDASTDGTKKIIEEYVEKYPEIIVPIYQIENQYSKGLGIVDTIMFPLSKGKYIALCEGDDYWCDENKLQLQFDFMESHPECSACFHNSIKRDLFGKSEDVYFNNWSDIHYLTAEDVICQYYVHTSSYFERREYFVKKDYQKKYWFGDYVRLTGLFLQGKLAVLPQVMSVYNANNADGVTYYVYASKDENKFVNKLSLIIEYLKKFNEISNEEYNLEVSRKINMVNYSIDSLMLIRYMKENKSNKNIKAIITRIKKNPQYKVELKNLSLKNRIRTQLKYNVPVFLYKMIAGKKYKNNGKKFKK